ncbi:MAG TPA: NTP transferase domain-containing protein [Candidatus Binataceae bacterium]|nr:NTP transferase domain-containing protein [Candidatus Binataceae bacterium]
MVADLQGAIIAAGRGERLRKAVGELPKPLVELDGETMLSRQARAMLNAGASRIVAVINSETAQLIAERKIQMPPELELIVRDTASSMESLFTVGERLSSGLFLLATVDAFISPDEFSRFTFEATGKIGASGGTRVDGALGVTKWRGDKKPLFAHVTSAGLITGLGGEQASMVTAGIYMMPTRIFELAAEARSAGLDALRQFLTMLIDRGYSLVAIEIADAIDVDEGADLDAARSAIKGGR